MKDDQEGIERLLRDIYSGREDDIQCDAASIQMTQSAEALLSEEVSRQQYPAMWQHFLVCPDCAEEYKMLTRLIQLQKDEQLVQPDRIPRRPSKGLPNSLSMTQKTIIYATSVFALLLLAIGVTLFNFAAPAKIDVQMHRTLPIQSLVTQSLNIVQNNDDRQLAILLAIEASRINEDEAAGLDWVVDNSLRTALNPSRFYSVLNGHEAGVSSVAFSPDGWMLASGSSDKTIRLWDISQPTAESNLRSYESGVRAIAFSPDGQMLAIGSDDTTIHLWNLKQLNTEPVVLHGHEGGVRAIAFSPDGQMLASGSSDKTIRLWDISQPTAEPIVLRGHQSQVSSVAFSPDGQTLASGSSDTTIRLWNLKQLNTEPIELRGHDGPVMSVAFSPDGKMLASSSEDTTIYLWDMSQSSAMPIVLHGHEGPVGAVTFSPDGKMLASGSSDRTIRLWDISQSSAMPIVLRGHEGGVTSIAFSPDGKTLASGSDDMTVHLWALSDELVKIGCEQVGRNLTWKEWQLYLPEQPYQQTCPNWPVHPSVPPEQR